MEVIPGCRQGRNYCNLELDFGDPEVDVIDQVKVLPVFLEGRKVFTDVVLLFGSSMPEVSDDSNGGLLAFVLIDRFKVVPGCMGRQAMLDVNKRFVSYILSNKVLSVIVILFPVVMPNWINVPSRLQNFSMNVGFDFAECKERPHANTPGDPVGTCESVAS